MTKPSGPRAGLAVARDWVMMAKNPANVGALQLVPPTWPALPLV